MDGAVPVVLKEMLEEGRTQGSVQAEYSVQTQYEMQSSSAVSAARADMLSGPVPSVLKEILEEGRHQTVTYRDILAAFNTYVSGVDARIRNSAAISAASTIARWIVAIYELHATAAKDADFLKFLDEVKNERIIADRIPQCEKRLPMAEEMKRIVDSRVAHLDNLDVAPPYGLDNDNH